MDVSSDCSTRADEGKAACAMTAAVAIDSRRRSRISDPLRARDAGPRASSQMLWPALHTAR
eukprot:2225106-Prymnesium_polylepis.1